MPRKKRLEEHGGVETVLVGARLPCIADNEQTLDGQVLIAHVQRTRSTGFVDVAAVLQTDGIFVMNHAGEIAYLYAYLPELCALAIHHKRLFLCPSQNRLLHLYHA